MLPKGLIVYTEDKYGQRKNIPWATETMSSKPPLAAGQRVQCQCGRNHGAIKDYGIGTLVGTKTYGKGLCSGLSEWEDGTAVKLTVSEHFHAKRHGYPQKALSRM